MRTISEEQQLRVRKKMRKIVYRHLAGTSAEITFQEGYPSMAPTDGNRKLLAQLNGINKDLGLPAMESLDPLQRGAGDISFVAKYVDGLVGLGAIGHGAHAEGETIELDSLSVQAKRAALLIYRLTP